MAGASALRELLTKSGNVLVSSCAKFLLVIVTLAKNCVLFSASWLLSFFYKSTQSSELLFQSKILVSLCLGSKLCSITFILQPRNFVK